jgi:hypothetical protein
VKSQEELNALFAQAREQRRALIVELDSLNPEERRERLLQETLLVQAHLVRWHDGETRDIYSRVGSSKAERRALDRQLIRISAAAGDAAKRYYGYEGSKPLHSKEPWREAVNDLLSELADVPVTIVTHEFERALHSYR